MEGKIHVLALPYPAEGHMTPLLHFTKRLASKGLKITLVIHETGGFKIEYICAGSENGQPASVQAYFFGTLKVEVSKKLAVLLEKLGNSKPDSECILAYDSTMPRALQEK